MAFRLKLLPVFVKIAHISLKTYPKQDIILAQDQFCLSVVSCTLVNLIYFIHYYQTSRFHTRICLQAVTESEPTSQPDTSVKMLIARTTKT